MNMVQDFNKSEAGRIARALIHTAADGAFGTLDADGFPHVSHVASATDVDGSPLVLNSDLALHTHNIRRDSRASLLFVAPFDAQSDTNTRGRVTLTGRVEPAPDRALARSRFVRRHPSADMYVDFKDMHLMRFVVERAYLVAGFGRIKALPADAVSSPFAEGLAAIDAGACEHMDEDHADALELIATRLAGATGGAWRAAGLDSRGLDLACGARGARAEFDEPLASAAALRVAMKRLTDAARAAAEPDSSAA